MGISSRRAKLAVVLVCIGLASQVSGTTVAKKRRAPRAKLTMSVSGPGQVNSTPTGIKCGKDCSKSFKKGAQVTLTAVPDADEEAFVQSWGGACASTPTTASCSLVMDSPKTASLVFATETAVTP